MSPAKKKEKKVKTEEKEEENDLFTFVHKIATNVPNVESFGRILFDVEA